MPTGSETFWLNATNIIIGAATVIFLLFFATVVVRELFSRSHGRKASLSRRLRSVSLHQLGFNSTDTDVLPDEKNLHPGMIPDEEPQSKTHSE